jgi:hypothetical protein
VLTGVLATAAVTGSVAALHTPDDASEQITETAGPGGTVTTDSEGDGATPADVVETFVTHLSGGSITIREGRATFAAPTGYVLVGEQVDIALPDNPAFDGIGPDDTRYVFRLDSTVAGEDPAAIVVLQEGAEVPACGPDSPLESPTLVTNPCVFRRSAAGADDLRLEVWHRTPGAAATSFTFAIAGSAPVSPAPTSPAPRAPQLPDTAVVEGP